MKNYFYILIASIIGACFLFAGIYYDVSRHNELEKLCKNKIIKRKFIYIEGQYNVPDCGNYIYIKVPENNKCPYNEEVIFAIDYMCSGKVVQIYRQPE